MLVTQRHIEDYASKKVKQLAEEAQQERAAAASSREQQAQSVPSRNDAMQSRRTAL